MILANAYHLYLRPGDELVKEMGGIQRFAGLGRRGPDGQRRIPGLQPRGLEEDRGGRGDVSVAHGRLQALPHPGEDRGGTGELRGRCLHVPRRMRGLSFLPRLYERLRRPHDAVGARGRRAAKSTSSLLFGIVQGGMYADLRLALQPSFVELDFDGYAHGRLQCGRAQGGYVGDGGPGAIGALPACKPRYLMGLGFPEDIVEGVRKGVDMFDCVIPTRHARNGSLFTRNGQDQY